MYVYIYIYISIYLYISLSIYLSIYSNNHPKRGGGLIIYYKDHLSPYISQLSCSKITKNLEQLWVIIKQPNHRTQIVSVIYRPPCGSTQVFFYELYCSLDFLMGYSNAETSILGDMNIDYRLRHTNDFDKIKDFEKDYQLKQIINIPTRITSRNTSILDLIFTDMEYIDTFGVLDFKISYHLPVFVSKKKLKIKHTFSKTRGRTYKNYVKEEYENMIKQDSRWPAFWKETNVNDLWHIMFSIILDAADQTAPMVDMKIINGNPEWFSHEILEEIHHKDELFMQFRQTKEILDWQNCKSQNNLVKGLIKNGKETFIKDQIEQNSGNPKKFWRYINNTTGLGKNRIKVDTINLVDQNGMEIQGNSAADYMNDYYATAGYQLMKSFNTIWVPNPNIIKEYDGFEFEEIAEYEILKLVKDIQIGKSSAYSNLSSRLFKDAFSILTKELAYVYNICLTTGVFPTEWGMAEVTPIPKTGNLRHVKNWRPISQIKLPGKLLERLIHRQLSKYFENILHKNQHGFRNNMSTGTAIFDVLHKIFENWNNKAYSSCIFIDYSKAFDTIDHNILLQKLKIYGLDVKSQQFFKSYLENRHQRININNISSNYSRLRCGVPQGSILGPLLFIIYTNDIFLEIDRNEELYMYADDTLLLNNGDSEFSAVQNSQYCLNKVVEWCKLNRLTLNEEKTKHLCITHRKQASSTLHVDVERKALGNVDTYDYLGFCIDKKLSMSAHIDKLVKKVGYKLHTLSLMRRYITLDTALLIYKVMIMPHFDYVDFVLDSANKKCTDRLERLHKRAIHKIEYKMDIEQKESYCTLLHTYNLTTLYQRRAEHLLLFMFKKSKTDTDLLKQQKPKIELRSKN